GKAEGRSKALDHPVHQIGNDVLRVVELNTSEEARIARDIGDNEVGRFRVRKHRNLPQDGRNQSLHTRHQTALIVSAVFLSCRQPAALILANSTTRGTIPSCGSMTPRLSTISKLPLFTLAMYMFIRT